MIDVLLADLYTAECDMLGEWKAKELKALAHNSFGIEDCEGAYSMLIGLMLDQIQSLTEKTDELEKKIASLLAEFDSTVTSITGVGPILGATIVSEIGDVTRFRSADKLASISVLIRL